MLTSALIRKHPSQSFATVRGHLYQIRSNLHSKQPPTPTMQLPNQPPGQPQTTIANPPHGCTCYIYAEIHPVSGNIAKDIPYRFPTMSRRSTKYLLIPYNYEYNAILADPTVAGWSQNTLGHTIGRPMALLPAVSSQRYSD